MSMPLFMTKRDDTQGILDIGKHCFKCQRLDFLPFPCEFCNHVYCSDHRTLELHSCPGKRPQRQAGDLIDYVNSKDSKEPVASLFPDRKNDMKKVDDSLNKPPKPTTILEATSFRVGDAAKGKTTAFSKFTKFLQKRKSSFVSKTATSATSTATSRKVVDLATLRKTARGDSKIQVADKIYVWVKTIDGKEGKAEAIFINKNWPAGRALDNIAELLRIRNYNNSTNDSDERLNMFLAGQSGDPILVGTSERCSRFKNGDEIFLVRGSISR
ncbi:CDC48-associated ubiquitin-like/zinc finger protein 1 [[Candida] railenensis]|uniref:CDC48-associated ubiquitin-like/zinc finger protein 1 n=1 Tax=[Candida] railenensis TaxID=45579 RepID=A0A9P0QU27_9ASCO|nr:CDC48-associated ubiquitin-like/zinc finger protein 1 [[Candida] railenensis]